MTEQAALKAEKAVGTIREAGSEEPRLQQSRKRRRRFQGYMKKKKAAGVGKRL